MSVGGLARLKSTDLQTLSRINFLCRGAKAQNEHKRRVDPARFDSPEGTKLTEYPVRVVFGLGFGSSVPGMGCVNWAKNCVIVVVVGVDCMLIICIESVKEEE